MKSKKLIRNVYAAIIYLTVVSIFYMVIKPTEYWLQIIIGAVGAAVFLLLTKNKKKTKITKEYLLKNGWVKYDEFLEWYLIIPGVSSPIMLELSLEDESAYIDDHVIQMDNTRSLELLVLILDGKKDI